ncbi:unnamed protein product [Macrosiphum euphorbiae]|uniref:Uncharacterized protein n=1 Tax=Macrosiphum euphorbiae TaxID=13131 RepID=A0AAV0WDQ8_9HEMI|nr:unnamed protein product [Macrosiphum euphorbiae]CAI6354029.1 unnamed protein product [Macrosiphum euphorbiae]CAI6368678.1 unnamed protein product [Macrosiphum euphorbiae]
MNENENEPKRKKTKTLYSYFSSNVTTSANICINEQVSTNLGATNDRHRGSISVNSASRTNIDEHVTEPELV